MKEGVPAELNEPFRGYASTLEYKNLSPAVCEFRIKKRETPLEKLLALCGVRRDAKTAPPSERFGKSL
jgi:hypothetical protein